jgi:hypothetical protein
VAPKSPRPLISRRDLEARAHQLARQLGCEMDGRWRIALVTVTLLALFDQQLERAGGKRSLDVSLDDEKLAERARALYVLLAFRHPQLFPPSYELPPAPVVRGWLKALEGLDLIGVDASRAEDWVSVVFTHAAPMKGKQAGLGSFYTPSAICNAIALAISGPYPWEDPLIEPCSGSGSMITSAWWQVCAELRRAFEAGELDAAGVRSAVAGWAGAVSGIDLDPEAVWTAAAQHAVRTGHQGRFRCGDSLGLQGELREVTHPYAEPVSDEQISAFRSHLQLSVLLSEGARSEAGVEA